MKKLIYKLSSHYADFETNNHKISAYATMKQTPGWGVHQEMLMLLRGMIAEDLLSERFTKLDATEKDVQQRSYAMADELIKFLLNPLAKAQKRAEFERGFEEATRRKQPKGELK